MGSLWGEGMLVEFKRVVLTQPRNVIRGENMQTTKD